MVDADERDDPATDAVVDRVLSRAKGPVHVRLTVVRRPPIPVDASTGGRIPPGRWFAVLELDGEPVLERGPFTNRERAEKAKGKFARAVDRLPGARRTEGT